jgi:basic membrane protein A and related proteins
MGINAFMLGAQSVDPNFKVKVVWVNTWFDPGKEADAAKALIDQGADIMVQHTDSTAPLQVAEKRGVHGFGQASDMIKFAPNAQLTALTDNWGPYYVSRVKAVLDGTWKSDNVWLGIKDDEAVKMAPFTNMPDDVKAMAEATQKKIAGGWNPFTGPVFKQDGSQWLKDGEVAKDETLLGMNFYVKGVDDKLPQ